MIETYYLACEQFRPYAVFDTIKEAKDEVQKGIDIGHDFRIAEIQIVAWHTPPTTGWKRQQVNTK